jgi:hypothetical protein
MQKREKGHLDRDQKQRNKKHSDHAKAGYMKKKKTKRKKEERGWSMT